LNTFSRVTIFVAKYPSDATLRNYADLQTWMYTHANKRAPVDICQSLHRMFITDTDYYDDHVLFHLHLICAEVYQTVGDDGQAHCQYNAAEILAKTLNEARRIMNTYDIMEGDQQRKKLKDIKMKLEFQSNFKCNLIEEQKHQSFRFIM
jgi:hypothetical protein